MSKLSNWQKFHNCKVLTVFKAAYPDTLQTGEYRFISERNHKSERTCREALKGTVWEKSPRVRIFKLHTKQGRQIAPAIMLGSEPNECKRPYLREADIDPAKLQSLIQSYTPYG